MRTRAAAAAAALVALVALQLPWRVLGARQCVTCELLERPLRMGDRVCPCRPCHACELDAAQQACVLVKPAGQSLSDGSELPVEQPEVDATAWFLTQDELTQSRSGITRNDLAVFTTGNVVSAYVAPSEFFHAVAQDVRATSAGDRIFLTSWSVDNTPFEPESDPHGAISGFQNIFAHAVVRGAEVYALAHANFWEKTGNLQVRDFLNSLPSSPNGGAARFLFDDRLASPGNSHHQKTLVIEDRRERIAYVGGIDLTSGRWDTLAHTRSAGWMDCHVRVFGPAAADVATNFLTRWNSSATPDSLLLRARYHSQRAMTAQRMRVLLLYCVFYWYCCGLTAAHARVDLTTATCHAQSSYLDMLTTACICEPCALCFFKFGAWACRSLADDSTPDVLVPYADDLLGLDQPLLHADDWFLTSHELTRSRGGVARDDLAVFSHRNHVELFPATDAFFASVSRDLDAMNDSDAQVLLTGWSLANVPFLPTHRDWRRSTFHEVFGRAMSRGVRVRALVWANVLERAQNIAMQHWMNAFHSNDARSSTIGNSSRSNATFGLLLFDNRLPHATSSHHQKTLVLLSQTHQPTVAYVGGIDLTTDRWDSRFHNTSQLRRRRVIAQHYDGWLDASVRIEGPAAHDVAANFVMRWNAKTPPLASTDELLGSAFANPARSAADAHISLPPLQPDTEDAAGGSRNGTASVQIVRTFSCKAPNAFAPRGELSLLHARLKAIARAQNYIYIEDQYFILVPALQTALLQQLPRLRALVVVTQLPSLGTSAVGYGKLLYDMLAPLTAQFPDKVHVFTMKPALELYIHTKLVLIDDVFVSVGSGNWNKRSMTSDSELAANVVDAMQVRETPDGVQVNALGRAMRLAKFSELSGARVDDLSGLTLFESIHVLERAAASASSLLTKLDVKHEVYFDLFPSELEDVIDPFDECL